MRSRSFIFCLVVCFMLGWVSVQKASASDEPTVQLLSTPQAAVGEEIQIDVRGQQVEDVYAYELVLTFDEERLVYVDADTQISGFSVRPLVEGGRIRLAHTKIGMLAGESGSLTFYSLHFRAIAQGEATVRVESVKLVDSKLEARSVTGNAEHTLQIDSSIFQDIQGHWAEAEIQRAIGLGFVKGYEDYTFRPDQPVTRSEFVVLVSRVLGLPLRGNIAALPITDLVDLPDWAKASIHAAYSAGIVTGYEDGAFRGERLITRTESVVLLTRAFNQKLASRTSPATAFVFSDVAAIPAYAERMIRTAASIGLVEGNEEGAFLPGNPTSRAEAVALLLRFNDLK